MLAKQFKNILKQSLRQGTQRLRLPKYTPVVYNFSSAQSMEFKAETHKLLQIVAKSLYTDKEVFLRELISNASDALEKRKFSGEVEEELKINIFFDEDKNQLVIQDSGIGMTQDELITQLGTIAKSGSEEFIKNMDSEADVAEKIIGQFGVGFYSVFIVGDTVEVITKKYDTDQAFKWSSQGESSFEVEELNSEDVQVGTKIIIHLKSDCKEFAQKGTIQRVIEKHSNFVEFPILINGEVHNVINALWTKSKQEVTEEEYTKFWEYVSNSKSEYKYKLHISIDAPLDLKALLYIPKSHSEQFGMSQEEFTVNLYSRKILIKPKCKELLPNYLRFIKGAVDSQDLSLNISRESYQDSQLIRQLQRLLTKRILRYLDQQAQADEEEYAQWYKDFQYFIKEGLSQDHDNQTELLKLTRYESKNSDSISLDKYIENKQEGQDKIYYILVNSKQAALHSPHLEPFKSTDLDILYTQVHIDEMVFRNIGNYRNYKFVNIESDQDDLKDLTKFQTKTKETQEQQNVQKIDDNDVTSLCLFLKSELQPVISKVIVSDRLSDSPTLVQSPMSTGMRQMMQMMDKQGVNQDQMLQNLTLEINTKHKLIRQLNACRKNDSSLASLLAKQLLDNSLISQNMNIDNKAFMNRLNNMMEMLLDSQNYTEENIQNIKQSIQSQDEELSDIKLDNEGNVIIEDQQQTQNESKQINQEK